jgi:osmoprotectant transport system substrate-binding protein
MKPIRIILALLAVACLGALAAGCGSSSNSSGGGGGGSSSSSASQGKIKKNAANSKVTLTIGSKNFTEQKVLGEIYAEGLQAAGYTVKTDLNLGDQDTALKAVKTKQIDGYPEYTGTALVSFFGVQTNQLPHSPAKAFDIVKQDFAKQGIVAFPPTPFTDSNEVGVTKATAQKYHLVKISDLSKVASKLKLYGSPECRKRLDCLLGLEKVYGLHFKSFTPIDISQRHAVLSDGRADVSIVFTTDPQIKREGEVLLQDDKHMFPPYNSTLIMRKAVADQAGPDLAKTIQLLNSQLTDQNMQELNARVDLDKKAPAEVAKEYLQETGMTAGS